jgi:hypothetical protein
MFWSLIGELNCWPIFSLSLSLSLSLKSNPLHQLLASPVVIDVGFGRDDHSLIPRNYDREGAGIIWCQNWHPNQIMRSSGPNSGREKRNQIVCLPSTHSRPLCFPSISKSRRRDVALVDWWCTWELFCDTMFFPLSGVVSNCGGITHFFILSFGGGGFQFLIGTGC